MTVSQRLFLIEFPEEKYLSYFDGGKNILLHGRLNLKSLEPFLYPIGNLKTVPRIAGLNLGNFFTEAEVLIVLNFIRRYNETIFFKLIVLEFIDNTKLISFVEEAPVIYLLDKLT